MGSPEKSTTFAPQYILDGRLSVESLYHEFFALLEHGWHIELAYYQGEIPVWAFLSPIRGRAKYIIGGIHGEEPGGPNGIAQSTQLLIEKGKEEPIVIYGMCSPVAYSIDWRYFNEPRDKKKGLSVGDSIHYLKKGKWPTSKFARELSAHVLKTTRRYPPGFVMDLHEDEDISAPYFYFYGDNLDIPKVAIEIAERNGLVIQKDGVTDRGEKIVDGVVLNSEDDSLDELLFARSILKDGSWITGPSADAVLVVETPVFAPLQTRIAVHKEILSTFL